MQKCPECGEICEMDKENVVIVAIELKGERMITK